MIGNPATAIANVRSPRSVLFLLHIDFAPPASEWRDSFPESDIPESDKARGCHRVIRCQEPGYMSPQSSIAHYKIVAKVGEGGMGAV